MELYEWAVIGAGPAGIAALAQEPNLDLIEA